MKWKEVWKKEKSIYKDCETLRFDKKNNLTDIMIKFQKIYLWGNYGFTLYSKVPN